MKTTINERLNIALEHSGRSIRSLHLELHALGIKGSSYSTVYSYMKNTKPSLEFIEAAAKALGVHLEWLRYGKGRMLIGWKRKPMQFSISRLQLEIMLVGTAFIIGLLI